MGVLKDSQKELFCQKWHETNNKSEAYRYAYPNSLEWKDESVHNKGSALSKNSEVAARHEELKQETANKHGVTIDSLLAELEEARAIALSVETPQSSAAVSATMGKAKLTGLDITRIEITEKEELTPWDDIEISTDG